MPGIILMLCVFSLLTLIPAMGSNRWGKWIPKPLSNLLKVVQLMGRRDTQAWIHSVFIKQGCPTFCCLWATKKCYLGPHIRYIVTHNHRKTHNVLSKFVILCQATFIAILGHVWPVGRWLDTPVSGEASSENQAVLTLKVERKYINYRTEWRFNRTMYAKHLA